MTLPALRRTHSIIDSQGFVEASVRRSAPRTPTRHGERLGEALRQGGGRPGVRALELSNEDPQLLLGAEVIVSLPRPAHAPAHRGPRALGQVIEHVSLLVAHAALDGRRVSEHVADGLA